MQTRKEGETRVRTQGAEHPENRTKGAEPQDTQEQRQGTAVVQEMRVGLGDAQKPELRSPLSLLSPKLQASPVVPPSLESICTVNGTWPTLRSREKPP